MNRLAVSAFLVGSLTIASARTAEACSCNPRPPLEDLSGIDAFWGTVVSEAENMRAARQAELQVRHVYSGKPPETVKVMSPTHQCGYGLLIGESYLVIGNPRDDGNYSFGLCSRSKPADHPPRTLVGRPALRLDLARGDSSDDGGRDWKPIRRKYERRLNETFGEVLDRCERPETVRYVQMRLDLYRDAAYDLSSVNVNDSEQHADYEQCLQRATFEGLEPFGSTEYPFTVELRFEPDSNDGGVELSFRERHSSSAVTSTDQLADRIGDIRLPMGESTARLEAYEAMRGEVRAYEAAPALCQLNGYAAATELLEEHPAPPDKRSRLERGLLECALHRDDVDALLDLLSESGPELQVVRSALAKAKPFFGPGVDGERPLTHSLVPGESDRRALLSWARQTSIPWATSTVLLEAVAEAVDGTRSVAGRGRVGGLAYRRIELLEPERANPDGPYSRQRLPEDPVSKALMTRLERNFESAQELREKLDRENEVKVLRIRGELATAPMLEPEPEPDAGPAARAEAERAIAGALLAGRKRAHALAQSAATDDEESKGPPFRFIVILVALGLLGVVTLVVMAGLNRRA